MLPLNVHSWTLNWQDNADNEDGYKVERAVDTVSPFTEISIVGVDVVNYVDASGTFGNCYRVRATNQWGNSGYSNVACAGFLPSTPTELAVTP